MKICYIAPVKEVVPYVPSTLINFGIAYFLHPYRKFGLLSFCIVVGMYFYGYYRKPNVSEKDKTASIITFGLNIFILYIAPYVFPILR